MMQHSVGDIGTGLPRRVAVVGTSGSGKTTMARRLAGVLGIPHVELDALHWEPGWTEASEEVFRERVERALSGDAWVTDGNYGKVRDLIWPRAQMVVWLDYSLPVIMRRLGYRTMWRVVTREELWNGNRERIREALFSRESIILWALQTYRKHRRDYPALLARPEHSHLRLARLRSPRAANCWLERMSMLALQNRLAETTDTPSSPELVPSRQSRG